MRYYKNKLKYGVGTSLSLLMTLFCHTIWAQCCTYKLSMQDSYGDGWNGAEIQVRINNILIGTYSAQNFGSIDSFTVCNGENLQLKYLAGNYEAENSYRLYDGSWRTKHSAAAPPPVGIVYNAVGNCNALPQPGNNPCNAIRIDTAQCKTADNTGYPGAGFAASCASYAGADVWFALTVPPSGNVRLTTDSGTINDTGLSVWTGTNCASLTQIECDDDSGNGYYSMLSLYDLVPAQTLYIQVFGYGTALGSFQLCAKNLPGITIDSTDLPLVIINTTGLPINDANKVSASMQIKDKGVGNMNYTTDSANVYDGTIGIEFRGASSAAYPQKPYGIETRTFTGANNNVPILGMPADNDWTLLSNYNDRSLLRNALSCHLFGAMGNYTVRTNLCEVVIDSSYKGIYTFAEKIKRNPNRVNIAKLTAADTTGDALTGGYILGQGYWDANNSFQSNYSPIDHPTFDVNILYEYPKPDQIPTVQKNYIAAFVDTMETALYTPSFMDTATGYRKYLDTKSFIDYFLINELARNADGFKKSVFFHKDKNSKGGKLKAGPVWDFDWAWKNIQGCSEFEKTDGSGWAHKVNDCFTDNYSTGWYIRLLQDSTFANQLRCTYENYRTNILDTTYIFHYIDSIKNRVQNAQVRHFEKWLILGVSGPAPEVNPVATTYNAEIDTLKQWIIQRITWLDANMPGLCTINVSNAELAEQSENWHYYPSPTTGVVHFEKKAGSALPQKLIIYNGLGEIMTEKYIPATLIKFDHQLVGKGVYYFKIISTDGKAQSGKILVF
jgi:hypothetical protein